MESEAMKKALASRRGKGIDLSIILGPVGGNEQDPVHGVQPTDKEYEEARKSDLAPPPDHPLDHDHAAGEPAMHPMQHSPLAELKDSDLLDGMNDHDKMMASDQDRAPRSLGERARKEMILAHTAKKK